MAKKGSTITTGRAGTKKAKATHAGKPKTPKTGRGRAAKAQDPAKASEPAARRGRATVAAATRKRTTASNGAKPATRAAAEPAVKSPRAQRTPRRAQGETAPSKA